jgi:nuclear-control-of-ATPase protein 2
MDKSSQNISHVLQRFGRPSWLSRYWIPITFIGYTSYVATAMWIMKKQDLFLWMRENIYNTMHRFLQEWVAKPLYQVYKTIRYDEDRIAIMNTESVHADLEVRRMNYFALCFSHL